MKAKDSQILVFEHSCEFWPSDSTVNSYVVLQPVLMMSRRVSGVLLIFSIVEGL